MSIMGHLLSFIFGFLASLTVGILLVYWQFLKSIAGYRVKKVEEATHAIIKEEEYVGTLRNRYRYSL